MRHICTGSRQWSYPATRSGCSKLKLNGGRIHERHLQPHGVQVLAEAAMMQSKAARKTKSRSTFSLNHP